ncbi:MAG: enoyl-CoA hydratase/isomerase family protein [Desulfitobacteriaceae bacterium]
MFETIIYTKKGNIAEITLNRPKQMNAINQLMIDELGQALQKVTQDNEANCLIIKGNEKFFCAGADITEVNKNKTTFDGYQFSSRFQQCFARFEEFKKPVVVAIEGLVMGGGFELMLACDFRVVAEEAKLALPEVNIGALPAGGGTVKLPRMIGRLKATELLLFGEPITGKMAAELGIVNVAVPRSEVVATAENIAAKLASKSSLVVQAIKGIINKSSDMDIAGALDLEARGLGMLVGTEDFHEGTLAFLEKRKPVWQGR